MNLGQRLYPVVAVSCHLILDTVVAVAAADDQSVVSQSLCLKSHVLHHRSCPSVSSRVTLHEFALFFTDSQFSVVVPRQIISHRIVM